MEGGEEIRRESFRVSERAAEIRDEKRGQRLC
jgi:hypothetical protein